MTYEIYRYIFIGALILSVLMFLVSVLLFILLKIPRVVGDLTGRTARKAIENIRNQNESSGDKAYRSSVVNRERGRLTDKISPSGRLERTPSDQLTSAMPTAKIGARDFSSEETTVLGEENATTVLSPQAEDSGATTVLSFAETNETTVLSAAPAFQSAPLAGDSVFEIEYEITYIHTNEVVPTEVT